MSPSARPGHCWGDDGRSHWRIFAPRHREVTVVLLPDERRLPLTPDATGHWHADMPALPDGTRYLIEVDGRRVPDPASRRQPDGVHGASQLARVEPPARGFWRGVAMEDAVLYELHLGTFTPEGTLAAAAQRLPHLADLGITVVELMPVAAFPGERNWGYDGTYPFALHAGYGGWADLRDFIEAAHALGVAVLLDVVHNHFGPEGNYSAALAPYGNPAPTPWGAAINLDGDHHTGVREFFLDNIRHWIADAGFDGLRMDAVSSMFDNSPVHYLRQATDLAHAIGRAQNRHVLMIAEHLRNDWHVTSPAGFRFDSQWNDDVDHAVFAHLTGERSRHCANFGSFADVVRALDRGFVHDGTRWDRYRCAMTGTDPAQTRAVEHVVYIQNHDQVGNRRRGDRLLATHGRAKALLAVTAVFATSFVPMLFMGEEYGETAPFYFFEDFGDAELVEAVRAGRLREFDLDGEGGDADEPPAPHTLAAFDASKLRWDNAVSAEGRATLAIYRQLIALKRSGVLGPRDSSQVRATGDEADGLICIDAPRSRTLLNFSSEWRDSGAGTVSPLLCTEPLDANGRLAPFAAVVLPV